MQENEKNYLSKTEKISMNSSFGFGLLSFSRGMYWELNANVAQHESPFYEALNDVAPLYYWGLPFVIGGLLLMLAAFFIINQNTKKVFDILLFLGSFTSMISYLFIAMASMSNNLNWLTPVNNTIFFVLYFTLMWIGLSSLWTNRKRKN